MGSVILKCIPMMIGAAVVPVWIILALLLLRSQGGLLKAIAFVSGQILVRLVQGILFGSALNSSSVAHTKAGAAIIVNTVLLLVGIFLWITALRKWTKDEESDAPPPKWMAVFTSMSALKIFLSSLLLMTLAGKQWLFTLGALGIIREADLPISENVIVFLLFVLGAHSLVLTPIVMCAIAPERSSHLLEVGSQWLERNNRAIVIVVSLVFGAFFIFKGIQGLL